MKKYFKITKVICLLMLAGTFTVANAQCDLKLTEKVTNLLKDDGFTYLKDLIFEFDQINRNKAYSFLLNKDTHFFLYFGVSENDDSEIEFAVATGNKDIKVVTVKSSGKIAKVEITPEESAIYDVKARSTKGEKSCGVIILGASVPANNSEVKTTAEDKINLIADDMPEFIIGEKEAFQNWAKNNLKYPEAARNKGIAGKIYITFVVNQVGDVTNINVVRGLDPEVDTFYMKELKKCPRWQKPGKNKGKPVNIQFTIPVEVKPK